jgi:hypothetical protein
MTSSVLINTHAGPRSLTSGPLLGAVVAVPRLRLLPSGDGWSLIGDDGRLVFSALGLGGRRRCLEYAQSHGVVTLIS